MPDQGSWKITHSWGIKLDVSKCMVIFWGRIFLKHDIVPCFFLFGVGVMFVGPRLYRWDGPESPSTPRLVAASTDPHNAALCVAMDAHLAVVRSAFRRCELGCVQPDGGCEIEDQKPMPRYLKMEVKTSGSSVCIHMVYGIRYIYIYTYILYIIYIFMQWVSEVPHDPRTWGTHVDVDSTLILDLSAVKGTGASIDTLLLYFITSRNFEVWSFGKLFWVIHCGERIDGEPRHFPKCSDS